MKNRIINIGIIIFTFFVIYSPPIPFLSFNVLHLIGLISWLLLLLNIKHLEKIIDIKKIILLIYVLLSVFLYLSVIKMINGRTILDEVSYIYWIFDIIPFVLVLILYFKSSSIKQIKLLDLFLIVGFIQSIISIYAYFNKSFHNALVNNMINYGYGDIFSDLSSHRLFGYSSSLTFTMPIFQSVLVLLALYLGLNKKKYYFLLIPTLLISSLINARTPIVILLFGIIFVILYSKVKISTILKFSVISILLFFSYQIIINVAFSENQTNIKWILDGFNEIIDFFFFGRTDGFFFSYFVDESTYRLPESINVFFGTGTRSLNDGGVGVFTDIGFINDIWLGGIFYLFISIIVILWGIYKVNYKLKFNNRPQVRFFTILLVISMLISNFKGVIVYTNEITTPLLIIYLLVVSTNSLGEYIE